MTANQIIPIRGTFPQPPSDLNDTGKTAWDLGIPLWNDGVLVQRDLLNWRLFCEAVQEREHCQMVVKRDGEYQCAPNGCYAQHPAVKRRQQAENVIRKYSAAFGLLPDARKKRPAVAQAVATRKR